MFKISLFTLALNSSKVSSSEIKFVLTFDFFSIVIPNSLKTEINIAVLDDELEVAPTKR